MVYEFFLDPLNHKVHFQVDKRNTVRLSKNLDYINRNIQQLVGFQDKVVQVNI